AQDFGSPIVPDWFAKRSRNRCARATRIALRGQLGANRVAGKYGCAGSVTRRTNRWTRAAGACFVTSLVRRRVLRFAPPRQLDRSPALVASRGIIMRPFLLFASLGVLAMFAMPIDSLPMARAVTGSMNA